MGRDASQSSIVRTKVFKYAEATFRRIPSPLDAAQFIGTNPTDSTGVPRAVWARLARLNERIKANPTQAASAIVLDEFPELLTLVEQENARPAPKPLPTVAPLRWPKDRRIGENSPQFTKRVYGEWLDGRMARADIKYLDKRLYVSLNNYVGRHGSLPADLNLPSKAERNTLWVDAVTKRARDGAQQRLEAPQSGSDAARFAQAARRREKYSPTK